MSSRLDRFLRVVEQRKQRVDAAVQALHGAREKEREADRSAAAAQVRREAALQARRERGMGQRDDWEALEAWLATTELGRRAALAEAAMAKSVTRSAETRLVAARRELAAAEALVERLRSQERRAAQRVEQRLDDEAGQRAARRAHGG